MAVNPLLLSPGEHDLEAPIEDSRLELIDGQHGFAKVVLVLGPPRTDVELERREVLLGQRKPTTLSINMGREATLKLMRDLASVARTMGWRPPPIA